VLFFERLAIDSQLSSCSFAKEYTCVSTFLSFGAGSVISPILAGVEHSVGGGIDGSQSFTVNFFRKLRDS